MEASLAMARVHIIARRALAQVCEERGRGTNMLCLYAGEADMLTCRTRNKKIISVVGLGSGRPLE